MKRRRTEATISLSSRLSDAYPTLSEDIGPDCPLGPNVHCPIRRRPGRTLEATIIHLQDEHGSVEKR
jgi:hypothetical protein